MRPLFLERFNFLLKRALPLADQVIYSINTINYYRDNTINYTMRGCGVLYYMSCVLYERLWSFLSGDLQKPSVHKPGHPALSVPVYELKLTVISINSHISQCLPTINK